MSTLEFNDDLAKQLEAMYARRDVVRRRQVVQQALAAAPGEDILDVGCGPGFYVTEILDAVGPQGSVTGIDSAAAMLAIARGRAGERDNVTFHEGEATALPVADASFDAAVSVQVLEYVADVPAALRELHRVVRPGGRIVLWDVDWATVAWRSRDAARMQRMLAAWDHHLAHPSLPQTFAPQLRDAGFTDVGLAAHTFATSELDLETYGGSLTELIAGYAVSQGGLDAADAEAWRAEQAELGSSGEFFFSVTQFCFTAQRPG